METLTGLDRLARDGFGCLKGKTVGVVCHQASIARDYQHILDHLLPLHEAGALTVGAVFGPQHGIWGHTQDNMIEWEGYVDERTGLRFFSLYGEHREPTAAMLEGLDELVFDVQDVGSRYYTFIWTLANCMKACEPLGIPVRVLDRPNPISGSRFEDLGFTEGFESFVGLYPMRVRHGLTIGEIALELRDKFFPKAVVEVEMMTGWQRHWMFGHTGLSWALPSPNMPTVDTALVYPGMCLIEGTQISEGRGTTRPFEVFGAPFVDGWAFCSALNSLGLEGVVYRPVQFLPTFQKHAGEVCQGAFVHVSDQSEFRPVEAGVAVMWTLRRLYGEAFEWLDPPYEYEETLWPIDILTGGTWVREAVDGQEDWGAIRDRIRSHSDGIGRESEGLFLYGCGTV